jgi:hypothetical protein
MKLRPRHGIAALALALASTASVPAFAQSVSAHYEVRANTAPGYLQAPPPVYVQTPAPAAPAQTVYVQPAVPVATPVVVTQMPVPPALPVATTIVAPAPGAPFMPGAAFAFRTREQMNAIERADRDAVARGLLRPEILGALRQDRAQIETTLARAMRDGIVRPFEARRVEGLLTEMNGLSAQFQVRAHSWHRGDGPDHDRDEQRGGFQGRY